MTERHAEITQMATGFEPFLRQYYLAGNELEQELLALQHAEELEDYKKTNPGFQINGLTDEAIAEVYDLYGNHYVYLSDVTDQQAILFNLLEFGVRDTRTLSIGCGGAPYEIYCSVLGLITSEVVGVDLSDSSLRLGEHVASSVGARNIRFERSSGSAIEFQQKFGQIFIIDSLHWMQNWQECLRRAAKALENEGSLFICYPLSSARVDLEEVARILISGGLTVHTPICQKSNNDGNHRAILTATKTDPD